MKTNMKYFWQLRKQNESFVEYNYTTLPYCKFTKGEVGCAKIP